MRNFGTITLRRLQATQPWTIPYSHAFREAYANRGTGHLMGAHAVLHAQKTVGQLAAIFEQLDHTGLQVSGAEACEIRDKAADLVTAAMRLANLYKFDLAEAVVRRSEEKNRVTLSWAGDQDFGGYGYDKPI